MRSYSKKRRRQGTAAKNGPIGMIDIRQRPGNSGQGLIIIDHKVMRCALGRKGIRMLKREGDGATPLAQMAVLWGYIRCRRMPGRGAMRLVPIEPRHGWCDAPADRNYNRPVRLPYGASHERLTRADRLYDACVVLDYNIRPRRRARGSAIFLHVAAPGFTPTEGCIAIAPHLMRRVLPRLSAGTRVRIHR